MNLRQAAEALISHWEAGEYENCTGIMAGHIADLSEALQPKVEHLPKRLSDTDQKIVDYCARPQTSAAIAMHTGCTMSAIYRHLRLLQRLEPVAYVTDSGKSAYILLGVDLEDDTPLYLAPPQKEWVGLTDDDIWEAFKQYDTMQYVAFSKAIEAKLREKNS